MRKVVLDGREMTERPKVHPYLQQMLGIQSYVGNNLDALWDVLRTYDKPIHIELHYKEELLKSLGKYGESLVKTVEDVTKLNPNIYFQTSS